MDRPSLDHFIGRTVKATKKDDKNYKIILDGGAIIYSTRKLPDELKGKVMTQVIMSDDEVRAVFFDETVSLHPTNYMISTPDLEPFHPGLPEELEREDDVPDPSADRIFDGPENDPERSVLDMRDADLLDQQRAKEGSDEDDN